LKVENLEDQELYLSCLAIDAGGNITVLYPVNWDVPEEAARIDRASSLVIPLALGMLLNCQSRVTF
jgi:hypothetical protein